MGHPMKFKKIICAFLSLTLTAPVLTSCSEINGFFSNAISVGGDVWSNVTGVASDVASQIVDGWNQVVNWGSGVWDDTCQFVGDSWRSVSEWGKSTWKNVVDWSANSGEAVANWGRAVIDGINGTFCSVGDYVLSIRDKVVGFGLKKGVEKLDLFAPIENNVDWKQYKGDEEAIAYSLFSNQMASHYEVFPAKVISKSEGTEIYGFGFTDGEECYVYDKGLSDEKTYYSAGFVSLVDELPISDVDIKSGLEIIRCDDTDASDENYFYAYTCEPFDTHVVYESTYMKYGVNSNHQLYYEAQPDCGTYDQARGSLYSYNTKSYLIGSDDGFVPTKGSALNEAFDFDSWAQEATQASSNGFSVTLDSLKNAVTQAVKTIQTVIHNLEEQTILGYNITDLKNAIDGVHEDDVAEVNSEKVAMHSVSNAEATSNVSDLAKWLTGVSLAIVVIANILMTIVFPGAAALTNAVIGGAIQTFVEVVIQNHDVSHINWIKVAIASISGALIGVCGLALPKAASLILSTAIGSFSESIFNFMDGKNFLDCSLSFVSSFAISLICVGLFTGVSKAAKAIANKVAPKLCAKVGLAISNGIVSIRGKVAEKVEGIKSEVLRNWSKKAVARLMGITTTELENLSLQSIKSLPADSNVYFMKTDADGNVVTKAALLQNGGNGRLVLTDLPDNPYRGLFVDAAGNPVTYLEILNGKVQFGKVALTSVVLPAGETLVASRAKNFSHADQVLFDKIINHDSSVPSSVFNYFADNNIDLATLTLGDVKTMRSVLQLTWHESEDGVTLYLVDSLLHSAVSHMGGFAYAKAAAVFQVPVILLFEGA